MRANNLLRTYCHLLVLVLPLLASSCSKDETTGSDNDYCYIRSVTLGTIKRKIEMHDRQGNIINTLNTTFSGSVYPLTIDLRTGIIENRDPLPFGSQLSAVTANIAFDGSLLTYRESKTNGTWTAYNSADSLNLTKPLELYLVANNNLSHRIYTLQVNVHKQEGDSLSWQQCDDAEATAPLADMTDMKAFLLGDKLMVIGKKSSEISLAERTTTETSGTWQEVSLEPSERNTLSTAEPQTLRLHDGTLYISTSDGKILSSTDALHWQQKGTSLPAGLTLVEKTDQFFYAISEGRILRSADASDWEHEETLDSDPSFLPSSSIRTICLTQANGNCRIILVGQKDDSQNALVWHKMWNDSEREEDAQWVFFPISPDNQVPCPALALFNLLCYDGKCLAFGGASADGTHSPMDALYVSQDYGISWWPDDGLHIPVQLGNTTDAITSTVDNDNFIWIITNTQVWRGRLNRLASDWQ